MKKTKYLNKTLFSIIGTLGLGGAIIGGGIFVYTSANTDQLELLTRAIEQDNVRGLQRARGDIRIESGGSHSAAIIGNYLYMWGNNQYGQLGTGDTNNRHVPTRINVPAGAITDLSLGGFHTGAIIDGKIYMWGYNGQGQLGTGNTDNQYSPISVNLNGASSLELGNYHTGAIVNGQVFMWGANKFGQLGDDTSTNKMVPTAIYDGKLSGMSAVQISLGYNHSGAIFSKQGKNLLFTWGANNVGQLGTGSKNEYDNPMEVNDINKLSANLESISFGGINSSAIVGGEVYTWGQNGYGQLGIGKTSNWEWAAKVPNLSGIISMQVGLASMSALASNGRLYTWGDNGVGQLGSYGARNKDTPWLIANNVTQNTRGDDFITYYDSSTGNIRVWGSNRYGQLGIGSSSSSDASTIKIYESNTINLDSSNDPDNKRNQLAYNISDNDIKNIINRSIGQMNLPNNYSISNVQVISNTQSNNSRIMARIGGAFPVQTDITINGFKPVNLTQYVPVPDRSIPIADATFINDEINQLIYEANADTTGTKSKLAKWIIDNSSIIIGNTSNEYTPDFPINTRITRVRNFRVADAIAGKIDFQIDVDKYYKYSTSTVELVESTASDRNITLIDIISLSGFNTRTESNPTVITTSNRDISSLDLKQLFGYVNNATNITGNGLAKLNEYIDLSSFPTDTNFKIIDPQSNGATELSFQIEASKYYDRNGIFQDSSNTFARLTISGLKDVSSILVPNMDYDRLTPNGILKYIGYDSRNPTAPLDKTKLDDYLTITSPFPMNAQFRLASNPIISTDNTQLTFSIQADTWFNVDGSIQTTPKTYGPFTFNGLIPILNTEIKIRDDYEKNILSGDLVQEFGWDSTTGTYDDSIVSLYVDFSSGVQGASYTMENLGQRNGEVFFVISTNRIFVNGIVTEGVAKYNITISGLKSASNSNTEIFIKDNIIADGEIISHQIMANIQVGTIISYTDPLWNQLVNTNIYPPNTTFTITNIATNNRNIFKTFTISFIASNYYANNVTMNTPAPVRTIDITNIKFSPTTATVVETLPDIEIGQFLPYIGYQEKTGAFDASKLQEFVTLTGFDLSNPGITTKLTNPQIVVNDIIINLQVSNYVGTDGIGVSGVNLYTISLALKPNAIVSDESDNSRGWNSKDTIITATSVGGGILLFFLIIFIVVAIRRNRLGSYE